ncbi:MAG: SpaA isopeptide-forming pilin-related protein [Chloroflexota bacterium]|nr:SpaA isopeptide-forming pilin-related protein [Chloroflexota bacterium]
MIGKKGRRVWLVVAVVAAFSMVLTMTSVTFAGGDDYDGATTCVDGWVINHREVPVDGTEFDPTMKVYAFGMPGNTDAANLPDMATLASNAAELDAMGAPAGGDRSSFVMEMAEVGSDGYFKFEDLPADYYYTFAMQLPPDWDGIVPQAARNGIAWTGWAKLSEVDQDKEKCHRIVFKIRRLFDVTVIKWEELLDGTVQPGEGWKIDVIPQGDPFVHPQNGTTGADGTVVFTITPGKWMIKETVKPGWQPVTPPHVYLTLDQYAPPGATDPVIFKNREPACYGEIIVEKNGLGTDAETGDLVWLGPLAGWKITLTRTDGSMYPVSKYTDASGKVTFKDLRPGVYEVQEYVQSGWKAVSDNPQVVVLENCETARVLFENEEIAGKLQIKGKKLYNAWVPPYKGQTVGLSGWEITATLKGSDPERSVTTYTNALGEYEFTQQMLDDAGMAIPGATITVCEEDRDNWIHITPDCVDVTFPYPVPPDYTGVTVNFTNIQDPPLPGTGAAMSSSSAAYTGSSCSSTHVVRPGENMSSIAAQYGTSVRAISSASGVSNPNYIRAGQTLCVQ